MSRTNELLESLANDISTQSDAVVYTIDPKTRVIDVPNDLLLGVSSDERVNRIYFTCPKIVGDNIDLTKMDLRVNYKNANGKKGSDPIDDVEESETIDGNITFSWLLSRDVTISEGSVAFNVCAILKDGSDIKNEWNTIPALARAVEGLEPDSDSKNGISMIRGDSFMATLSIEDEYGVAYTPQEGDTLVFTMKRSIDDSEPALVKNIPIDTVKLTIIPEDTQSLDVGTYVYSVKLKKTSGEVYTVISASFLTLIREVT